MDTETSTALAEMQEQIAALQQQVEQLQKGQKDNRNLVSIALKNLLTLCRWAYPQSKATGNKYTAEIKAGGVQIKACFPEYR